MFTLSARGVYGLTAVLELARSYNKGPVQIRDISDAYEIPQHYLEQLLVVLKKAGIVESFRGSQGGYALASSPDHTSVLDVLTCLDGKIEVVPESKRVGPLEFFWSGIERAVRTCLDKSLDELLNEKRTAEQHYTYNI